MLQCYYVVIHAIPISCDISIMRYMYYVRYSHCYPIVQYPHYVSLLCDSSRSVQPCSYVVNHAIPISCGTPIVRYMYYVTLSCDTPIATLSCDILTVCPYRAILHYQCNHVPTLQFMRYQYRAISLLSLYYVTLSCDTPIAVAFSAFSFGVLFPFNI
jgi:hypothetical protein